MPWPEKSPYKENLPTPMPEGIVKNLTILHWWQKNDVEHHPNAKMFFQPRAGLHRFKTKDEGDMEIQILLRWKVYNLSKISSDYYRVL